MGADCQDYGLVFTTALGTPLEPRNVNRRFDELREEAGLPWLRLHDLRHRCATFLLGSGLEPRTVMEILGHSTIRLTMDLYGHVLPEPVPDRRGCRPRYRGPQARCEGGDAVRLYLSSFRLGEPAGRLVELVRRGGRSTVSVVANAVDGADEPERRSEAVSGELDALSGLGLEPHELDLRDYRAGSDELERHLAGCGALWMRGGNVFTLRHAMMVSGADRLLPRLITEDALVYAGYSAGPCVLAPSLSGLELCDDADEVRRVSRAEPIFEGLGVLDRAFVPHLDSPGHPETELLARVAQLYRRAGTPFWALSDGQALVVDGTLADATLV